MKHYCPQCGYGTEYDSVKPKKCKKCGMSYGTFVMRTNYPEKGGGEVVNKILQGESAAYNLISEDPLFHDSMPPDVEPVSREELDELKESIAGNKSFNLRDILQENSANPKRKAKKSRKK